MRLSLQESNAGVHLAGQRDFLVDCWIVEIADEGGVVCADVGDIRVFAVAHV